MVLYEFRTRGPYQGTMGSTWDKGRGTFTMRAKPKRTPAWFYDKTLYRAASNCSVAYKTTCVQAHQALVLKGSVAV